MTVAARVPLKWCLDSLRDGTHGTFQRISGGIPLLSAKNISSGRLLISDKESTISEQDYEAIDRNGYLAPGDVLLSIVGSIGNVALFDTSERVAFQRSVAVLRPRRGLHSRYLMYQLMSPDVQTQIACAVKLSAQGGVYLGDLGQVRVRLPSERQQEAVVRILDTEIGRVDALLSTKNSQLDLLAEKRKVVVAIAVTRGLDPKVKSRNSKVPCLGEIPAHWNATRLKFLAAEPMAYGASEPSEFAVPSHPRFIRITDIGDDGSLREDTFRSLEPDVAAPYLLRRGDLLFARSGATVGKTFLFTGDDGSACFAGYLIRFRSDARRLLPSFVYAVTQSAYYWWCIREGLIQATIQNFCAEKYGDIVIAVPPLTEQHAIVEHIARETAKLDAVRAATERTIALLKERRSAIIATAVNGQLEVGAAT